MEPGDSQHTTRGKEEGHTIGGPKSSDGPHKQQELIDSEKTTPTTSQTAERQSTSRTRSIRSSLLAFSEYPHCVFIVRVLN